MKANAFEQVDMKDVPHDIPADVIERIEKNEKKKPIADKEIEEVKTEPETKEEGKEEDSLKEEQRIKEKEALEQQLGFTLVEDDIDQYIFKGYLIKEVEIIPNKLTAKFKTLTPGDRNNINKLLSTATDNDTLHKLYMDLQSQYIMAYCLQELGGKPTGEDLEEKLNFIRHDIGDVMLELLSTKFNFLLALVGVTLTEDTLKKG